jgi:hypothetical protein
MKPAPSLEVDTSDPHSFEAFTGELIAAGFVPGPNERTWVGPIDAAFNGLTEAASMTVVIQVDGLSYDRSCLLTD